MALTDIRRYMKEQNIQIQDDHGDVWIVTANTIDCPEQRRLNAMLGVNRVNYYGNKNQKQ